MRQRRKPELEQETSWCCHILGQWVILVDIMRLNGIQTFIPMEAANIDQTPKKSCAPSLLSHLLGSRSMWSISFSGFINNTNIISLFNIFSQFILNCLWDSFCCDSVNEICRQGQEVLVNVWLNVRTGRRCAYSEDPIKTCFHSCNVRSFLLKLQMEVCRKFTIGKLPFKLNFLVIILEIPSFT